MSSQKAIGERHHTAISELTEILVGLDPELSNRLRRANHDIGIPSPTRKPLEAFCYHAELMRSIVKLMDERLPKKRGRPPKVTKAS